MFGAELMEELDSVCAVFASEVCDTPWVVTKTMNVEFVHEVKPNQIYQTHSPCKDCSRLILQSGIKRLVYGEDYKDTAGLDLLSNAGIEILKYETID
jgi:deoxycytidylate deaminase